MANLAIKLSDDKMSALLKDCIRREYFWQSYRKPLNKLQVSQYFETEDEADKAMSEDSIEWKDIS